MKLRSEHRRNELMYKYANLIASMRLIHGAPKMKTFYEGFEVHHIVPASTFPGGRRSREANSSDNLCLLNYRQHYIAHLLLAAIDPAQLPTIALPYKVMKRQGTSRQYAASVSMRRQQQKARSYDGLIHARANGKRLGRPVALGTVEGVQNAKAEGLTQSQAAASLKCSLRTVKRYWNA